MKKHLRCFVLALLPLSAMLLLPIALKPEMDRADPGQSSGAIPEFSPKEFPRYDEFVHNLIRPGMEAKSDSWILAQSPESLEAAKVLFKRGKLDEGIGVLQRFTEAHPRDILLAIDSILSSWHEIFWARGYPSGDVSAKVHPIVELAAKILPDLPSEQAAEVEFKLTSITLSNSPLPNSSADRIKALKNIIEKYPGTDTALDAEFAIIGASNLGHVGRIKALEDFGDKYKGTCAEARALSSKANLLAHKLDTSAEDPTDRFLQVVDLVKKLESESFSKCEKLDSPASFVIGFFASQRSKYAQENIPKVLDAYREFVRTHSELDESWLSEGGVAYIIRKKMPDLYTLAGESGSAVEKDLLDLEQVVSNPSYIRYIRAHVYMDKLTPGDAPENAEIVQQIRDILLAIQTQGSGYQARISLATLASLYYSRSDFATARDYFRKYAQLYPQSPYAWVASLRIGRCDERMGNPQSAISAYRDAVAQFPSAPLVQVLGHAYAARVYEELQEFGQARTEFEKALDAWDSDFNRYALDRQDSVFLEDPPPENDTEITRQYLVERSAQLARSAASPSSALLERGRWLLDKGKLKEAISLLEQFSGQFPSSANGSEARALAHKARLYSAFEMANADSETADEAAAMKEFKYLAEQPFDEPVCTAKISMACLLAKQGKPDEAAEIMQEALMQWQMRHKPQPPASDLEKDTVAIRSMLFLPGGDPLYNQLRGAGFPPPTLSEFLVVSPTLTVKFMDGSSEDVELYQDYPGLKNVLHMSREHQIYLRDMMVSLGGTKKGQSRSVMEVNRPIGDVLQILPFLNQFFSVRAGHWSGWELFTFPQIMNIEFTDKERTAAIAAVRTWNQGGNVLLKKVNGQWRAKGLYNVWIT